jgi:hypothetical protein
MRYAPVGDGERLIVGGAGHTVGRRAIRRQRWRSCRRRPSLLPIVPDLPGRGFPYSPPRWSRCEAPSTSRPIPCSIPHARRTARRAPVKLPLGPIRAAVAAAWNLHLVPASPTLVDLVLSLPVLDTARARAELEWKPSRTSLEAIREFLTGLRETSGMHTPPLEPRAGGPRREWNWQRASGSARRHSRIPALAAATTTVGTQC